MDKKSKAERLSEPVTDESVEASCPQCGSAMTNEAVRCMICGYNLETGQGVNFPALEMKPAKKRPTKTWIQFVLIGSILIGVPYSYIHYEALMLKYRHLLPKGFGHSLPDYFHRPFYPRWMKEMQYKSINRAYVDMVSREMNEKAPTFKINEPVTLLLTNGKAPCGVYKGSDNEDILLETDNGIVEISLNNLETRSRAQCDKNKRQEIIDKVAHSRTLAFLMGDAGGGVEAPVNLQRAEGKSSSLGKQDGGSDSRSLSEQ